LGWSSLTSACCRRRKNQRQQQQAGGFFAAFSIDGRFRQDVETLFLAALDQVLRDPA
jgi:hypothetical protein